MKIVRWAALLVGSLCLFAWPSFGSDIPPVTPDELKMANEPLAPGAPPILLYRQIAASLIAPAIAPQRCGVMHCPRLR